VAHDTIRFSFFEKRLDALCWPTYIRDFSSDITRKNRVSAKGFTEMTS
jgi:hypothetical protein